MPRLLAALLFAPLLFAQIPKDKILFGAAYYYEYTPTDRLAEDVKMMQAAGINVVRIAESTWATLEPRNGVFVFSHIDPVLDAMHRAGISVIVGTPTYAIPSWLAREYPDVLVQTPSGQARYGPRQNMDITHPEFRRLAERAIRQLIAHVKDHPAVIGYQVDNETKPYRVSSARVQKGFVDTLRRRFRSIESLNLAFGLDYWSNRLDTWDDFPPMEGAINASVTSSFAAYQRSLVTDYLAWQAGIVRELKRPSQFITHNFDLDWRGYSYGIQTEVDHFAAARALDIAGIDIYHPSQDRLTGTEIALGGDIARSMRRGQNYFVIETEAQGFPDWTPYPGQLRLQGFSHLASGANMLSYWHWATTHNNVETYWRGLLAQDYRPNAVYQEAARLGADLQRLSPSLINLRKSNKIAIYFSNNAQTAFNAFGLSGGNRATYNDVLRPFYDSLYRHNLECDFVDPSTEDLSPYRLLIVPALYAASDSEIRKILDFVKDGGHLLLTFKSGFSDENVKVRATPQPGGFAEAIGASYSLFALPQNVALDGPGFDNSTPADVRWWAEFLTPTSATVLARYRHPAWSQYAALTRNTYGKGQVTYVGFMPSEALIDRLLRDATTLAGIAQSPLQFPLITRSGRNAQNKSIHYLFNYSDKPQSVPNPFPAVKDLLNDQTFAAQSTLDLPAWGVRILEETTP